MGGFKKWANVFSPCYSDLRGSNVCHLGWMSARASQVRPSAARSELAAGRQCQSQSRTPPSSVHYHTTEELLAQIQGKILYFNRIHTNTATVTRNKTQPPHTLQYTDDKPCDVLVKRSRRKISNMYSIWYLFLLPSLRFWRGCDCFRTPSY